MLVLPCLCQVGGFNQSQPQYAYAVGAIAIVMLLTTLQLSYKLYKYHNRLERQSLMALVASEIIILTFGVCRWGVPCCIDAQYQLPAQCLTDCTLCCACPGFALFGITTSYVLLATILFAPPVFAVLTGVYSMWSLADFELFVAGGFSMPRMLFNPQANDPAAAGRCFPPPPFPGTTVHHPIDAHD